MAGINRSLLVVLGFGIMIIVVAAIQYSMMDSSEISTPAPSIEIFPDSYDFGNVPYSEVKTVLEVRNTGGLPLEIRGVLTSCGCTKAYIEEPYIPPGGSANLTVTFDPNVMGLDLYGRIFRIVYVKSNDPDNPEVEVEISANVVK